MSKKVLYLDDNTADLMTAVESFKGNSVTLKVILKPKEAIEELKNGNYDLFVCDIMLASYDGLELAHDLVVEQINVCLVFTSGLPALARFQDYKGIDNYKGFILKPVTLEKVTPFLE